MKKRKVPQEMMYVFGMLILPLGVALMAKADFGVSMVVAPAYIMHLYVSRFLPFFSFGMAEYTLQAALIAVTALVMRRFRWSYLLSFVTAVLYGLILDGWMLLAGLLPAGMAWRAVYYLSGMLVSSLGVACFFHTYIAPEAYELIVKELAEKTKRPIHRVKTVYDVTSCALSVILSFAFFGFGNFEGVKLGTVVCALINGFLIGRISAALERHCEFPERLPWRGVFEK